jgi:hypothetical protein
MHKKSQKRHLEYYRHFEDKKNHQTSENEKLIKLFFQNMFCFPNRLKNTKVVANSENCSGRRHFELFSHFVVLKIIVLWYFLNSSKIRSSKLFALFLTNREHFMVLRPSWFSQPFWNLEGATKTKKVSSKRMTFEFVWKENFDLYWGQNFTLKLIIMINGQSIKFNFVRFYFSIYFNYGHFDHSGHFGLTIR